MSQRRLSTWGDPTGSFFSGFSGSADLLPPGAFIWSKTESFVFLCSQNKCLPCFQPLWAPGVSGAPRPAIPASSAPALCGDARTARPPPRRGASEGACRGGRGSGRDVSNAGGPSSAPVTAICPAAATSRLDTKTNPQFPSLGPLGGSVSEFVLN